LFLQDSVTVKWCETTLVNNLNCYIIYTMQNIIIAAKINNTQIIIFHSPLENRDKSTLPNTHNLHRQISKQTSPQHIPTHPNSRQIENNTKAAPVLTICTSTFQQCKTQVPLFPLLHLAKNTTSHFIQSRSYANHSIG